MEPGSQKNETFVGSGGTQGGQFINSTLNNVKFNIGLHETEKVSQGYQEVNIRFCMVYAIANGFEERKFTREL